MKAKQDERSNVENGQDGVESSEDNVSKRLSSEFRLFLALADLPISNQLLRQPHDRLF